MSEKNLKPEKPTVYFPDAKSERVIVSFVDPDNKRCPGQLRIGVPGTERLDDDGDPIPGTSQKFTFTMGKEHTVDRRLAAVVLEGPVGLINLGSSKHPNPTRVFIEGRIEKPDELDRTEAGRKVKELEAEMANKIAELERLIGKLQEDGQLPVSAEKIGGETGPISAGDLDLNSTDGRYKLTDDGCLICPLCNNWISDPPGTEKNPKNQIRMHMTHCAKKAG